MILKDSILAIVVTYNGGKWISDCIDSLAQSSIPVDIAVVDNASSDDTLDILNKISAKIKLFKLDKNIGFGQGNNIALNYALENNYGYVFLINQDARVESNTIELLKYDLEKNSSCGLISPVHLNWEGGEPERGFLQFVHEGIEQRWYSDMISNKGSKYYTVDFINAAFWLIPTEVLMKVGGFDPIFSHYGEDNDWVNRMRFHGFKSAISFEAKGYHASNYKDWSEIQYNSKRVILTYLNELKNINSSLKSNIFLFSKKELDTMMTCLCIGKFRKAFIIFTSILYVWRKVPSIAKARRISKMRGAFLNDF